MHIGKRVQELRKQNGMTQQDLTDHLGISLSMMKKIEIGNRDPGTDTLMNLSYLFHCSTDYLLGIEEMPRMNDEQFAEFIQEFEKEFKVKATDGLIESIRKYIDSPHYGRDIKEKMQKKAKAPDEN